MTALSKKAQAMLEKDKATLAARAALKAGKISDDQYAQLITEIASAYTQARKD